MNLRDIRLKLGLSQLDFALTLGVQRSLLSMAELRKRSLPAAALVKLQQLIETIDQVPNEKAAELETRSYKRWLQARLNRLILQLMNLSARLKQLEARIQTQPIKRRAQAPRKKAKPDMNARAMVFRIKVLKAEIELLEKELVVVEMEK